MAVPCYTFKIVVVSYTTKWLIFQNLVTFYLGNVVPLYFSRCMTQCCKSTFFILENCVVCVFGHSDLNYKVAGRESLSLLPMVDRYKYSTVVSWVVLDKLRGCLCWTAIPCKSHDVIWIFYFLLFMDGCNIFNIHISVVWRSIAPRMYVLDYRTL